MRNSTWSPPWVAGTKALICSPLPPRTHQQEAGLEAEEPSPSHSDTACGYPRQQLNLLCHNTHPQMMSWASAPAISGHLGRSISIVLPVFKINTFLKQKEREKKQMTNKYGRKKFNLVCKLNTGNKTIPGTVLPRPILEVRQDGHPSAGPDPGPGACSLSPSMPIWRGF